MKKWRFRVEAAWILVILITLAIILLFLEVSSLISQVPCYAFHPSIHHPSPPAGMPVCSGYK